MELALRSSPVQRWLPLLLLPPLLLGLSAGAVIDRPTEEGKEVWDYVTVRKDAYMFWWLYYATNPCKNFSELPLVMWLQLRLSPSCRYNNAAEEELLCVSPGSRVHLRWLETKVGAQLAGRVGPWESSGLPSGALGFQCLPDT
ncbi:hypothetical protein P7K49_011372 [Saguinus oedipus]|uniref:Uncharacterized protein n=1 Tax=Saguinus oedipus TaxID=9490 RepID=A0ABQ9VQJ4_SAGOE|nr:hypothetical protein P7K49_011372 [Saguinus oedipus]